MKYKVGVMNGDGIGPEIVPGVVELVDRTAAARKIEIDWREFPMGFSALESHGSALPDLSKEGLAACDACLVGPHNATAYPDEWRQAGGRPPSAELRDHFDLYANLRPARTYAGISSVASRMDLLLIRENTEGLLADRNMHQGSGEFMPQNDVALMVGVFTRAGITRVLRQAFEAASVRSGRLVVSHKAGALPMTFGMYKSVGLELAADYPDVELELMGVGTTCAMLVRDPASFDVIVAENFVGDVLTDLANELSGSVGLAPSLNVGDAFVMAQAAHGSAPDIAGQGIANPIGVLRAAAMMFGWLGARHDDDALLGAQRDLDDAIVSCLDAGIATADIGGRSNTQEVLGGLAERIS